MKNKFEKIKKELAIITPSYNNGILLKRLYKSVQKQSYKSFIWIIIDDGSTDNTEKIVSNFKIKNLIYIKQKNLGANAARNKGEKYIPKSCKYVIYIDSDDTFYNEKSVSEMVNEIKITNNTIGAIGFSSIDSQTRKSENYLVSSPLLVKYLDTIKAEKFSGEFLSIQKKEIINICPWPENISGYEAIRHWEINRFFDYVLTSKIARVYFRDRKENLTSPESTLRRSQNMAYAIDIILKNHGKIMREVATEKYSYFLITQGIYYSLSGFTLKSIISILKSLIIQKKLKNKIFSICLLVFNILPIFLRKKIYILIRRKSYKYVL